MASRSLGTKTSIWSSRPQHLAGPHAAGVPAHAAVDHRALFAQSRHPVRQVPLHADVGRADAGSADRPLERVRLLLVGDELALVDAGERDRDRALEPGRAAQPGEIEIGLSRQHGHHVQSERIVAELGQQSGPGAQPGSRHGPVRHAARRELERRRRRPPPRARAVGTPAKTRSQNTEPAKSRSRCGVSVLGT